MDRSKEQESCPSDGYFRCKSSRNRTACIAEKFVCDGEIHCPDMSDETNCSLTECKPEQFRCKTGQCLPLSQRCDYMRQCLDGSDENNCERSEGCGVDEFRCDSGQCIPLSDVCFSGQRNGLRTGCYDNSHLLNCSSNECGEDLFKCWNSYCIPQQDVCNVKIDCPPTSVDEETCKFACPHGIAYGNNACVCYDDEMDCTNSSILLKAIPDTTHEKGLHQYLLSGNKLGKLLDNTSLVGHEQITYLDISSNGIHHLERGTFSTLWKLNTLILANNNITELHERTFEGLYSMKSLNLNGNCIHMIHPRAFLGASSLMTLDLSRQKLVKIQRNAFVGLVELTKLDLSHNDIRIIVDGAFNGLRRLMQLDISSNPIAVLGEHVFNGIPTLHILKTDEFRLCCMARSVPQCYPEADEFSSCEDLMSNYVLRICIWLLAVLSLCGNAMVIAWRLCDTKDTKVHSFLIIHLAIGDMLMGVYLLIIAIVDHYYRGVYILHAGRWRSSSLCQLAGFLSTFSSELSVLSLTVITMDRFGAIAFPFQTRRLSMANARLLMIALWAITLLMAGIPLMGLDYFTDFYGRSGVCLALHITASKPPGWEYSVAIFLVMNLLSFSAIAVAYIWMFAVVSRSRSATRGPETRSEQAMARRMSVIVGTDFCCWVPISLMGLSSLAGANIPPQVYAWVAVFILPLNSAVNPVLYTISTATFISQAKYRLFRFRRSFTQGHIETKSTVLSCHEERYPLSEKASSLRNSRSYPGYSLRNSKDSNRAKRSSTENEYPTCQYSRNRPRMTWSESKDSSNDLPDTKLLNR